MKVNGGTPTPRYVPCEVYSGETHVPVYEFARWDDPAECVRLCRVYHEELGVPRRYLLFTISDADTFYLDMEQPGWQVMYFPYVERVYESHFGDGEMDCTGQWLEEFMVSFVETPRD